MSNSPHLNLYKYIFLILHKHHVTDWKLYTYNFHKHKYLSLLHIINWLFINLTEIFIQISVTIHVSYRIHVTSLKKVLCDKFCLLKQKYQTDLRIRLEYLAPFLRLLINKIYGELFPIKGRGNGKKPTENFPLLCSFHFQTNSERIDQHKHVWEKKHYFIIHCISSHMTCNGN